MKEYFQLITLLSLLPLNIVEEGNERVIDHKIDYTISEDEWEILVGGSPLIVKHQDEVIVEQGKNIPQMYIIHHGSARAEIVKKRETHLLGYIEQGEIFGEIAFLCGRPSTCTITANEETSLYFIHRKYINLLFHSYPILSAKFYRHLCLILGKRIVKRENTSSNKERKEGPETNLTISIPKKKE